MFIEAVVTEVDIKRGVCKVRTGYGVSISAVQWLSLVGEDSKKNGSFFSPVTGDKVLLLKLNTGYVILGSMSTFQHTSISEPTVLQEEWKRPPTGNYSSISSAEFTHHGSSPTDSVSGDKVLSTSGGAQIAALRGGSVLLRASALCQMFLSKIDNLFRIVASNFEVFTDISSEYVVTKGERSYRFFGVGKKKSDAKVDRYKYYEVHGDVAAAEQLKGNYHEQEATAAEVPLIKKTVVSTFDESTDENTSGYAETAHPVMIDEQDAGGAKKITVQNVAGDQIAYIDHKSDQLDEKVTGSAGYGDLKIRANEVLLDWNNKATVKMNSSGIQVVWNNDAKITLNDSQVLAEKGSSKMTLTDSSAKLENGGSVTVTPGQVAVVGTLSIS